MPQLITSPTTIPVPGGKVIDEHVGRVNTGTDAVSVAHMKAPPGWAEPGQRPAFDEITLVLAGLVLVEHDGGTIEVPAGQSILTHAGERVRYSCGPEGAEYVAVCLPAFSPETVNREDEDPAGIGTTTEETP
ncbi:MULTISPECIES: cupin domain-containing protein [unclassified Janibacter]|uniref:cupin domain-containing protein n=1 Tax=unclassified Janibacter TaxID=2649294 RepID=UPI003D081AC0